jgi:hypothetical protein
MADVTPIGSCGHPLQLFWLKDEVWNSIPGAKNAPKGKMTPCVKCAEAMLGRPITLSDVSLSHYKRTMPEQPDFMREYAKATLYGACAAIRCPPPSDWQPPSEAPHSDAAQIGARLAVQTSNVEVVLDELIREFGVAFGAD